MRMEVNRHHISIIPETEIDIAYIEEVLGLKEKNSKAEIQRINGMGLPRIAYLKINKSIYISHI